MMSEAILAVLSLIESILPLVTGSSANVQAIDSIINALQQFLPLIVNEVSTVYAAVKNILTSLQSSGALTPDQLAATQALDTQVDAAWTAVEAQIDPDAPGTTAPTT